MTDDQGSPAADRLRVQAATPIRVSVVILTCNAEAFIASALESILTQSFTAFEVIVVDGDSTDRTVAIVQMVAARDGRVRLDRQPRTGIVDGRNRGAALAVGEYLAWLDADDVAAPYRLERQVQFLDTHAEIAAVGGAILVCDEQLRTLVRVRYPLEPSDVARELPFGNVLAASTVMLRLKAYQATGGCRAPFRQGAEDYDLWLRLAEQYALANLPDVLARYRTHPDQVSSRGIERFVIPTVAAQLSARARRSGRHDAYGDVESFSYELFTRLEPSRRLVDSLILSGTASQSIYLALVGHAREAHDLIEWAARQTASSPVSRRNRARLRLAEAVIAWKRSQFPRVAMLGIQSAALDPSRMAKMLVKSVRAGLVVRSRKRPSRGGV